MASAKAYPHLQVEQKKSSKVSTNSEFIIVKSMQEQSIP